MALESWRRKIAKPRPILGADGNPLPENQLVPNAFWPKSIKGIKIPDKKGGKVK